MDGPPNIIHSDERPVLNGECSQSRRETNSSQKMDCSTSDGTSNTKASFPKEKLCKEDAGHLKRVQVHSFPHLQCNGNGSCTEQKQGVEVTESICRSSDYGLPVKDSHNNVVNEDRKGDASNGSTSIITKMQDSHGEDNEQIETLHELTDLTFQTDFEQSNLTVKENNNKLLSTCVDSVQITEKDENQVQDHDHEGESGSLGAEYVEDHTVALWVKVLHMDKNDYYGGESTSLNLIQLWTRFRGNDKPPAQLGSSRDYNVDMIPKFMMANGTLVRVLIHTNVTRYLSFKGVDGSYVFNKGKIHKVPATDMEALKSPLMGLFEKRRARKFFIYVQEYNETDPKTHGGLDLTRMTTKELIGKYGLDDNTVDFIGHALALHRDDHYLTEPALDTVKRMKLYAESLARFQGGSPYIYPLYGLAELPQAFARLSAVYGGTYMLNKPDCKVVFDEEGKACGVTSEGETAKCKKIVCDPSYLADKVKKVGKVTRAIAIMSHPIPSTDESHSVQVILPQKQLGRKSDMYLFCCSYTHNVAPKGKFIAFVSTEAETDHPETELKPGIDLLGPVDELFFDTYDRFEPANESSSDNCFISTSYDATTHFESTVLDVLSIYTKITGKTVDLSVDLSAASAAEE